MPINIMKVWLNGCNGIMERITDMQEECSYLISSHERCANYNIEKNRIYSDKIINDTVLNEKLADNIKLITIATPFMNKLYDFVKGHNFFIVLTDNEGCILNILGDNEILSKAFNLKIVPGAYMGEKNIGTNAMGTSIAEGIPVQISGQEHYIDAYQKWTCSAAPIKNSQEKIIGTLDITGYMESVHPHTLGMVVAAVNAIEKMFEINEYAEQLDFARKNTQTIFNSLDAGIITSTIDGKICEINKCAIEMFGFPEKEFKEMKVFELFNGFDVLKSYVLGGKSYIGEEVIVNTKKNKLYYNLSAYPVADGSGLVKQIICIFREIKKVRKLTGRILSSRAVYTFDKIIGINKEFMSIVEHSKKISDSKSTILIMGESGTGKEIFAQSIHNHSKRKEEAFIAVNCSAIPRTLIESELFGYEEGSFTGARRGGYAGKFELADGGTIFLDEIGDMPFDMQAKLLRVIEENSIVRIGSLSPIPIDVRIIAATNRNLFEEVNKGNFRKDLYYRLNVLPIYLPPLRERVDDIPYLTNYFMRSISKRLNKKPVEMPNEYMEYLMDYNWPGNIRELENIIELIINTQRLCYSLWEKSSKSKNIKNKFEEQCFSLKENEKITIIKAITKHKGKISAVAKSLGIARNTLYRKMELYNIDSSILEQCSTLEQQNK